MSRVILVSTVATVLAIGAHLPAQQPTTSLLNELTIATPTSFADGKQGGASASGFQPLTKGTPLAIYAYAGQTLCLSASARPERLPDPDHPTTTRIVAPDGAGFGWRLEITAADSAADVVAIHVAWRRVWDEGKRIDAGPHGESDLHLHAGDRVLLDYIQAPPTQPSTCPALGMGLEISLGAPNATLMDVSSPTSAHGLYQLLTDQKRVASELFLVEEPASGTPRFWTRSLESRAGVASEYFFDPISISTSLGALEVRIAGAVKPLDSADGMLHATLTITRAYVPSGTSSPVRTAGATYDVKAGAGEVLSFHLPPFGDGSDTPIGPAFSLRLTMKQTHEH